MERAVTPSQHSDDRDPRSTNIMTVRERVPWCIGGTTIHHGRVLVVLGLLAHQGVVKSALWAFFQAPAETLGLGLRSVIRVAVFVRVEACPGRRNITTRAPWLGVVRV